MEGNQKGRFNTGGLIAHWVSTTDYAIRAVAYDSIFRQKFVVAVEEVVACLRSTKILKFQVLGSTILGWAHVVGCTLYSEHQAYRALLLTLNSEP